MTFEELSNDSVFREKLSQAQTPEEAVALFHAAGVEMTEAQLRALLNEPEGELDESALEDVAGGFVRPGAFGRWLWDKLFGGRSGGGGSHRF